jgi:peptidyl-prolyl cis-trans isomerase A (cyclophilin A)
MPLAPLADSRSFLMNLRTLAPRLASICLAAIAAAQPPAAKPADGKLIFVNMSTTAGDIILELNNEKAPITVANFLKYADGHRYDGTIFHRVIPWFVIQGGGYTADLVEHTGEPAIKNEWTNGLTNVRGTLAMARDAAPDTATREFYFNVADNPKLDTPRATTGSAGYAVFGRVIAGMDVVDAIRDGATTARPDPDPEKSLDDLPVTPVVVTSVARLSTEDALAKAADAKSGRPLWKFWRFDEPLDGVPSGFSVAETAGKGARAQWRIMTPPEPIAPPSPPASIHVTATNSGLTFNLLMCDEVTAKDVSVFVRIHADAGKEDQGGGVIWRARDENNYYIARWNPLEDNFRVYYVKDGKRMQLGTADVTADPKQWHRIRIDHTGTKIEASLDGKTVISVDDATFKDAGHIGLWTKADASSWFDDLAVVDKGK